MPGRATQWLMHGVDVNTVKELLGHSSIQTTMRYVHYVQSHAAQSVTAAQAREYQQWEKDNLEVATKWRQPNGTG
ncbi:MAG: tyrosine-type recombinase/integrase [Acidobacteriota bacterium]